MLSFICGLIAGVALTILVLYLINRNPPNFLPW